MPRIPAPELERLKREVSLERLVSVGGVELRRVGRNLMGLCPFHDDHEPSLVITPDNNLWQCLGACKAGGSVIDWVMRARGVSFRHAVELLREGEGTSAAKVSGPRTHSTVKALPPPVRPQAGDQEILRQVVDYYHLTLKGSAEALTYLESRGLKSHEMVDAFKLGYANRTLGYRLPNKNRKLGAELRGRLQALGIMRESGHEHFSGSLVIPVMDEQGQVLEMYGRKVGSYLRPGTPLHLYLPGPHRGVFNLPALKASQEIILCESLIDALTFWCAGYRNVTASYGTGGFTAEHLAAFKEHKTRRVLIAYDRDQAGDEAASALAERLMAEGLGVFRIQFPRGMDANEYACKTTPANRSLGVAIRGALWLGKGEAPACSTLLDEPVVEIHAPEPTHTPAANSEPMPTLAPKPAPESDPESVPEPAATATSALPEPAPPEPPAPASPEAPPPSALPQAQVSEEEVVIQMGDRRWRVRGLSKNLAFDTLRVNLLVSRRAQGPEASGALYHVDTLDVYQARSRAVFIKEAARELGLEEQAIKRDLGRVLLKLEELQEEIISRALEPKEKEAAISDEDRAAALELLKDPRLLDRILADLARCGVVGEETGKLVGYLAATSRKLERPLAIIVQAASAAGKSSLMEAILSFMPGEEQVKYSAMTGQSLFYMGEADLAHKILAIVEEEGAEKASYALKLLQSEGELTIASTGKDATTGRLVTHEYRVQGPVMIFLTTTAAEVDEELLNRCLVLSVDEDRAQTRAIHDLQRRGETLEGLLEAQERTRVRHVHQVAQRLLRPLLVANPFARELCFSDRRTRTRRDHMKYLTLIRAIALLFQYQRQIKTREHQGQVLRYIEVEKGDIELAGKLCGAMLEGAQDELPPQTRRLLDLLDAWVGEACKRQGLDRVDFRFTRRMVREAAGWSQTQIGLHMARLEELEYLIVHRGGPGQRIWYELAYDVEPVGPDGQPIGVKLEPAGGVSGPIQNSSIFPASISIGGNGKPVGLSGASGTSLKGGAPQIVTQRQRRSHTHSLPPLAAAPSR